MASCTSSSAVHWMNSLCSGLLNEADELSSATSRTAQISAVMQSTGKHWSGAVGEYQISAKRLNGWSGWRHHQCVHWA